MKGRILVVNTGSTSTKIGFFDAGEKLFEQFDVDFLIQDYPLNKVFHRVL